MAFKQRLKPNPEFSSSSIADLVFLLLIFFMLTSTFVKQTGVTVDFPTSDSDKVNNDVGNSVTIKADGRYLWNSELMSQGKEREAIEADIRERIAEALTDDKDDNNGVSLLVDREVSIDLTTFVFEEVARNGGSVVIRTEKKK